MQLVLHLIQEKEQIYPQPKGGKIIPLTVHIFLKLKTSYRKTRRAVFNLIVHIVLVTKYRRKVINAQMGSELEKVFDSVLTSWDSELIEFNFESDHCHLIVSFPPHKLLSSLIANLKATSSKTMWRKFEPRVSKFYSKRVFWTGAYFVASCGGVTIDVLKKYVQEQNSPPLDPAAEPNGSSRVSATLARFRGLHSSHTGGEASPVSEGDDGAFAPWT